MLPSVTQPCSSGLKFLCKAKKDLGGDKLLMWVCKRNVMLSKLSVARYIRLSACMFV